MKCPFCGYSQSKVTDSRSCDDETKIKRRRECLKCNGRFTTYEVIENIPIVIIKKDNSKELFNRNKILNSVLKACEKRQISTEMLNKSIDEIENKIKNKSEKEIPSYKVGEIVLEQLKSLDEVAYIRFASVYRSFDDINSFINEVKSLNEQKDKK